MNHKYAVYSRCHIYMDYELRDELIKLEFEYRRRSGRRDERGKLEEEVLEMSREAMLCNAQLDSSYSSEIG